MVLPPLAGAVQRTVAEALPAVALTSVGAPGAVGGPPQLVSGVPPGVTVSPVTFWPAVKARQMAPPLVRSPAGWPPTKIVTAPLPQLPAMERPEKLLR